MSENFKKARKWSSSLHHKFEDIELLYPILRLSEEGETSRLLQ